MQTLAIPPQREPARVLVRLNDVARFMANADHSIIALEIKPAEH
jgi:hypothetical protein